MLQGSNPCPHDKTEKGIERIEKSMRPIDADRVVMHLNDYALQISPTGYETGSKKEKAEAAYETVQNCIKAIEEAQTVFGVNDAMKKTGECVEKKLDEAIERERQMAEECSIPCAAYKEDERTCESCRGYHKKLVEWLEQLKEYKQLEKEGKLLKLPCETGDHVYIVKSYGTEEAIIMGISEADDIDSFCFRVYMDPDREEIIALDEFKDSWFLTEDEAKARFAELRV